mmetsp:Transcript_16193/g.54442  ORF Transcript_16193/g.54442 Transcript_16193/m.54442 type:complete len:220 (-) Transcript_16193:711-1370(-)
MARSASRNPRPSAKAAATCMPAWQAPTVNTTRSTTHAGPVKRSVMDAPGRLGSRLADSWSAMVAPAAKGGRHQQKKRSLSISWPQLYGFWVTLRCPRPTVVRLGQRPLSRRGRRGQTAPPRAPGPPGAPAPRAQGSSPAWAPRAGPPGAPPCRKSRAPRTAARRAHRASWTRWPPAPRRRRRRGRPARPRRARAPRPRPPRSASPACTAWPPPAAPRCP